jgi:hypothetical protein
MKKLIIACAIFAALCLPALACGPGNPNCGNQGGQGNNQGNQGGGGGTHGVARWRRASVHRSRLWRLLACAALPA